MGLQKESKLRPNCTQIMERINDILNNEAYAQYFAQSDNLKQLKLSPENLSGKKGRDGSVFCLESPKSYGALVCGLRIPTPSPSSDSTESDHHDRNRNHNGFPLCSPSPSRSPAKGVRRNLCLAFLTPSPSPAKRGKKNRSEDESTAKEEADERKEIEEDDEEDGSLITSRKAFDFDNF